MRGGAAQCLVYIMEQGSHVLGRRTSDVVCSAISSIDEYLTMMETNTTDHEIRCDLLDRVGEEIGASCLHVIIPFQ